MYRDGFPHAERRIAAPDNCDCQTQQRSARLDDLRDLSTTPRLTDPRPRKEVARQGKPTTTTAAISLGYSNFGIRPRTGHCEFKKR